MELEQLAYESAFRVAASVRDVQMAEMVLAPGGKEGGPSNRHPGADQWLYVVSGRGRAVVDGREVELRAGSLLVIERGERHEIRNTGRSPLKTLNVYSPRAYDSEGQPLPAGGDE